MANADLQAESESANPVETIRELSIQIGVLLSRISNLTYAISDALDAAHAEDERIQALGRAIDFNDLVDEAAELASTHAEQIEKIALLEGKAQQAT